MASPRPAELGAYAGLGLLLLSAAGLAAAGPQVVAAATWLGDAGKPVPEWLLGPFEAGLRLTASSFYVLMWIAMAGYAAVVVGARYLGERTIWALGAACLLLFTVAPPLLSQDIFSYIAYARMGAEFGLNPYVSAPQAIAQDPVFELVGWPDTVSVYGPLFTVASYVIAPLSLPLSTWALKAAMGFAVAATAWVASQVAGRRGLDRTSAAALVMLNPLVLVHVVGGGHNDALVGLAVAVSVALVMASRDGAAGTAIVAGAAVKASGLFIAPFALLGSHRRSRLMIGVAASTATVALIAFVAYGVSAIEAVAILDANQSVTSHYSVPATFSRISGLNVESVRLAFLAAFAITVAGLCYWTWLGGDWIRAAGWAGLAMLVASGWLLPWYLIWVLPVVALARDRGLVAVTLAFTAFQLVNRVPL